MTLDYEFTGALQLIKSYSFLHDVRNVDFFVNGITDRLPPSWIKFFRESAADKTLFFDYERLLCADNLPSSLKDFLVAVKTADLTRQGPSAGVVISEARLKHKKSHEIEHASDLIIRLCTENSINRVVDIGCGIGHLIAATSKNSLYLEDLSIRFVGVEKDKNLFEQAVRRFKDSKGVDIKNVEVRPNMCSSDIQGVFLGGKDDRTLIVSLHGCGLLQPTIISQFSLLSPRECPGILSIGCCYHKVSHEAIPLCELAMSSALKSAANSSLTLNCSTLRLASQPPTRVESANELHRHEQQFLHRATLEALLHQTDLTHAKAAFKMPRSANAAQIANEVKKILLEKQLPIQLYDELLLKHAQDQDAIEPFRALQGYLQGVLESLILADRVAFLEESRCDVYLLPLFNRSLSPRNMAILAKR